MYAYFTNKYHNPIRLYTKIPYIKQVAKLTLDAGKMILDPVKCLFVRFIDNLAHSLR